MHTQFAVTRVDAAATLPLWEVATYRGLFNPGRTYYVNATSKYEAECLVADQLSSDEWFPTFSARPAPEDISRERSLTTVHV